MLIIAIVIGVIYVSLRLEIKLEEKEEIAKAKEEGYEVYITR